jgi:hypothetical protein
MLMLATGFWGECISCEQFFMVEAAALRMDIARAARAVLRGVMNPPRISRPPSLF